MSKQQKHWFLKRWFAQGLIVTIPISTTIVIIYYLVSQVNSLLIYLWGLLPWTLPIYISPWVGVVFVWLALVLIGALTESWLIGKGLLLFNKIMSKVPIIRAIYNTIFSIVESILGSNESLSKPVIIEFPRKGVFAIAFKTSECPQTLSNAAGEQLVNVFIPTTPNPTSGFYLLVPEKDIISTTLTSEEAFKLIVSAGIVQEKDLTTTT